MEESITVGFIEQKFPIFLKKTPTGSADMFFLDIVNMERIAIGQVINAQGYMMADVEVVAIIEERPAKGDWSHPTYKGRIPIWHHTSVRIAQRYVKENKK